MNPHEVLSSAKFKEEYSQMVIVKDIDFFSLLRNTTCCLSTAKCMAYIPNGYITGLSKIARGRHLFSPFAGAGTHDSSNKECIQQTLNPLG